MPENTESALSHIGFKKAAPSKFLADYIDCYWFINAKLRDSSGYNEFLHPDGGMGIVFNYGSTLQFNNQQMNSGVFVDGTNTKSVNLHLNNHINAAGVRFKPAGAYHFLNSPLNELKNTHSTCADFNIQTLAELNEYFYEVKDTNKRIAKLDSYMLKLFNQDKQQPGFILEAVSSINHYNGTLSIKKLASQLNIGQRRLERNFNVQLGMSPLEYSKTIRIELARNLLKQDSAELTDISHELGFYDQAHFINQFKSVIGITPGEYRKYNELKYR